jgi:hypothetical protein
MTKCVYLLYAINIRRWSDIFHRHQVNKVNKETRLNFNSDSEKNEKKKIDNFRQSGVDEMLVDESVIRRKT